MSGSVDLGIPGLISASPVDRGGFGTVFRATETAFDRHVAVKVLHVGLGQSAYQRFDREMRALGRLSGHQGIVTLHRSGQLDDGRPYLVMGWADGGSVESLLQRDGPLGWDGAMAIVTAAADALAFAHHQGVIHRDIKPANLLLNAAGQVLVADLGIARIADMTALTPIGTAPGSPSYMDPAVLRGTVIHDAASDVFALAATAVSLATGRLVLEGGTPGEVIGAAQRYEGPDPGLLPAEVAPLLAAALSPDPADRPTMAALASGPDRPEGGTVPDVVGTTRSLRVTPPLDASPPITRLRISPSGSAVAVWRPGELTRLRCGADRHGKNRVSSYWELLWRKEPVDLALDDAGCPTTLSSDGQIIRHDYWFKPLDTPEISLPGARRVWVSPDGAVLADRGGHLVRLPAGATEPTQTATIAAIGPDAEVKVMAGDTGTTIYIGDAGRLSVARALDDLVSPARPIDLPGTVAHWTVVQGTSPTPVPVKARLKAVHLLGVTLADRVVAVVVRDGVVMATEALVGVPATGAVAVHQWGEGESSAAVFVELFDQRTVQPFGRRSSTDETLRRNRFTDQGVMWTDGALAGSAVTMQPLTSMANAWISLHSGGGVMVQGYVS